jgi:hypothetical protein
MKKLILIMIVLFIASSLPAEAQIDVAIGHLFQKIKGNKRHRQMKKSHRKNLREKRRMSHVSYM